MPYTYRLPHYIEIDEENVIYRNSIIVITDKKLDDKRHEDILDPLYEIKTTVNIYIGYSPLEFRWKVYGNKYIPHKVIEQLMVYLRSDRTYLFNNVCRLKNKYVNGPLNPEDYYIYSEEDPDTYRVILNPFEDETESRVIKIDSKFKKLVNVNNINIKIYNYFIFDFLTSVLFEFEK